MQPSEGHEQDTECSTLAQKTRLHDCELQCGRNWQVSSCLAEFRPCLALSKTASQPLRERALCETNWYDCIEKKGVASSTFRSCTEACADANTRPCAASARHSGCRLRPGEFSLRCDGGQSVPADVGLRCVAAESRRRALATAIEREPVGRALIVDVAFCLSARSGFAAHRDFSVPAPSSMALRALSAMLFWITTVSSSSSTAIPSPLNAKQLSTVAAVLRFSSEKAFC